MFSRTNQEWFVPTRWIEFLRSKKYLKKQVNKNSASTMHFGGCPKRGGWGTSRSDMTWEPVSHFLEIILERVNWRLSSRDQLGPMRGVRGKRKGWRATAPGPDSTASKAKKLIRSRYMHENKVERFAIFHTEPTHSRNASLARASLSS